MQLLLLPARACTALRLQHCAVLCSTQQLQTQAGRWVSLRVSVSLRAVLRVVLHEQYAEQ